MFGKICRGILIGMVAVLLIPFAAFCIILFGGYWLYEGIGYKDWSFGRDVLEELMPILKWYCGVCKALIDDGDIPEFPDI